MNSSARDSSSNADMLRRFTQDEADLLQLAKPIDPAELVDGRAAIVGRTAR